MELELNTLADCCRLGPEPRVCQLHCHPCQRDADGQDTHPCDLGLRQVCSILRSVAPFQTLFESLQAPGPSHTNPSSACWYIEAALALHKHASNGPFSWKSAAAYLKQKSIIVGDGQQLERSLYFVFCLTGVLTCLYSARVPGGSPEVDWTRFRIEAACPQTSHQYWCFQTDSCEPSPHLLVGDFLYGLGDVFPLPIVHTGITVAADCMLDPQKVNIKVLTETLNMKIKWTDIMGAHLDYDNATSTLFLFRQPTLCLLHAEKNQRSNTVLQSCVAAELADRFPRLMQEILLSLYVLYGQCHESRSFFSTKKAFDGLPPIAQDSLLAEMCNGHWKFSTFRHRPMRLYNMSHSFPLLGTRLAFLMKHASLQEPNSLPQLWTDRRNVSQWWSLWAFIIIGVVGIVLSVVQAIEGGLQAHYTMQSAGQAEMAQ